MNALFQTCLFVLGRTLTIILRMDEVVGYSLHDPTFEYHKGATVLGCHFSNITFSDLCLGYKTMYECIFREVTFQNCKIISTIFTECHFIRCQFKNCKIVSSSIGECSFSFSSVQQCDSTNSALMILTPKEQLARPAFISSFLFKRR